MAFSSNSGSGPLSDINVTPMVDVMLVLLIIFMITAPRLHRNVQIDLPQPNKNQQNENPPEPIHLAISGSGAMSWNNSPIDALQLRAQLAILGTKKEDAQPELRIKAADITLYDTLAHVMAEAKNFNVKKIGFEK